MNDKTALVTGGSRGLGKNMALRLAEKGSDVILTYTGHRSEELERYKHFSPAFMQQTLELMADRLSRQLSAISVPVS